MQNLFILGLVLFSISTMKAQEVERKQEFQVSLDVVEGIERTNAYYKLGFKNDANNYWRARVGQFHQSFLQNTTNTGLNNNEYNLGFGFETRLTFSKKAQMTLGIESFGAFEWFGQQVIIHPNKRTSSWSSGILIPIGIIFNGSSKWYVGIETTPGWVYKKRIIDEFNVYNYGADTVEYGVSNFALCFGYRIPTKRI